MGFVQRAFTVGGGEAPEAIAQREAGAAQQLAAAKAAAMPAPPAAPAAPKSPELFSPGAAPGSTARARATASTMLGAAAAAGQTSKKTLLGQ